MKADKDIREKIIKMINEYLHIMNYTNGNRGLNNNKIVDANLGIVSLNMVFIIADIIGSYNRGLEVKTDSKSSIISKGYHFLIFNSKYYNFNIKLSTLEILYRNYRSVLVHNSVLPPCFWLHGEYNENPITVENNMIHIYEPLLIERTNDAVKMFISDIDKGIIENSQIYKEEAVKKDG